MCLPRIRIRNLLLGFPCSVFLHVKRPKKKTLDNVFVHYNARGTLLSRGVGHSLGGQHRQHRLWKRRKTEKKQSLGPISDSCLGPIYNIS